jgi:hypothetical protein
VTGNFTTRDDGASATVTGLGNQSNVFFGGSSTLTNTITAAAGTTNVAPQSSASASASANVSTTANAQTNLSTYTTGYANVLGTGTFSN